MRISRLKLSGFKSFVEPAELRIEPGLTGVVGPNGCGKSNLLEAIRWVMGENSPKSMRSGGMEDVIFAGTAQRPQRNFAEVVLHGESSGDDGRAEELEVVRRIERGAGSAYRVNGRDVRAKDVALTFADAATGAHSPALVSQGRIAAVIAAKPAERRQMLEEAAGIAGLHVRRRDAEQKLRATEANLARLNDLTAGLDSQMASLRRQARAAERYTALSDRVRTAEARLLFARWRDAAAAADTARREAQEAGAQVTAAQGLLNRAHAAQRETTDQLARARDDLADRRDDTNAHGHRMAALTNQLESAEQRLTDLDRQAARIAEDQGDADRMTRDAAEALTRIEMRLADDERTLTTEGERRPELAAAMDNAERSARAAELAFAAATADQAGVEAEWRVAEAAVGAAETRIARLTSEYALQDAAKDNLVGQIDPATAMDQARTRVADTVAALARLHDEAAALRSRKEHLSAARDEAARTLASARAELAGIAREHAALHRDREARTRQASAKHGLPTALDRVAAAPGYERALAAVLGRDGKAALGLPDGDPEGRFWTGRTAPEPVADSLAAHLTDCPPQLAARLALVHVADTDDGRSLDPGEWLVTRGGALRRWDGFVARGEGAAEAARLEADNRFAMLDRQLPALQKAADAAAEQDARVKTDLDALQRDIVGADRALAAAADAERAALRAFDQAEVARDRLAERAEQIDAALADLADQREAAAAELALAQDRCAALPAPDTGRATLAAARMKHDAARAAFQATTAGLAAHDQALAVTRERAAAQRAEIKGWQGRAGDAARRLSDMARRAEKIAQERAVIAAKPASLIRDIEAGEAIRLRLTNAFAEAEAAVARAADAAHMADGALRDATETLASAREGRAGSMARAEHEDARRAELARISGERFRCPPPMLAERFAFDGASVAEAGAESAAMDRLVADRERIGPVNLVAAEELKAIEEQYGSSVAEQADLAEAVNRLRGSIGNLNREGRERLRAAFAAVDTHFRRLFTRLFDGGQAHLALIDSDDPLEAGLEIFAQPPGKRLQSLTLLSGGEQALTAVALIFALFLTNPAPICVLDEVDAPLDDANIERFCNLLDVMVSQTDTRYLIVTHNAVTMSRMHRLFGVTMIEPGVSRLVSVDLGGAEALLAAAE